MNTDYDQTQNKYISSLCELQRIIIFIIWDRHDFINDISGTGSCSIGLGYSIRDILRDTHITTHSFLGMTYLQCNYHHNIRLR